MQTASNGFNDAGQDDETAREKEPGVPNNFKELSHSNSLTSWTVTQKKRNLIFKYIYTILTFNSGMQSQTISGILNLWLVEFS